jgi:hypothetical protein
LTLSFQLVFQRLYLWNSSLRNFSLTLVGSCILSASHLLIILFSNVSFCSI